MRKTPLRIALTPGSENGVGPKLLVKAVSRFNKGEPIDFYWCGDALSIERACPEVEIRDDVAVLPTGISLKIFNDLTQKNPLERQAAFLDLSVMLAKNNKIDAIVTGPIEKAALAHVKAGPFPGQTEYYATHLPSNDKPFMAFVGGPFMLSLLTTHVPLSKVASAITEDSLLEHIQTVAKYCAKMEGKSLSNIRITVLGLNPHAGENGLLGSEEQNIFLPAIARARKEGLNIEGPTCADGFFAYTHHHQQKPNAVIAAYHDQGLAPYKLMCKERAVNVTFGLSHIRVSPAHGIARDLARTDGASDVSTYNAIVVAVNLVNPGICS